MLIQFTVENHRSIKNSTVISFAASKDKSFDEYLLRPDEKKALLPVLAIYGANAAGKSNVLHAMMTMKEMVVGNAAKVSKGQKLPWEPFGGTKVPTSFEMVFIFQGVRYTYGFSFDAKKIELVCFFLFTCANLAAAFAQNIQQLFIARFFMDFTQDESCGKCTPCRVGTRRILEILERICAGKGQPEDLDTLEYLCAQIKEDSLCGLGQGAPTPVISTLKHFRKEYEAHIFEKRCPAKVCKPLIRYEIIDGICTGCTVCARNCPVNAISGERRTTHVIDPDVCIRCGICMQVCNFNAIVIN